MRSIFLSKIIFASCVWYSDRANDLRFKRDRWGKKVKYHVKNSMIVLQNFEGSSFQGPTQKVGEWRYWAIPLYGCNINPWAPHMRNSISHKKKITSKAFGRTTRPSFYALVREYKVLVEIVHWPAVPHMKKSIAQVFFSAKRGSPPWDDCIFL